MTTITSRVLIKFWGGGKAVTQGFWAGILKNGMGTSRMHRLENKGRVRDRPPPSVGHLISARRLVSSGESRVKGETCDDARPVMVHCQSKIWSSRPQTYGYRNRSSSSVSAKVCVTSENVSKVR